MGSVNLVCPRCGLIIARFTDEDLASNKAKKRSRDNLLKNPVLCLHCGHWVKRLKEERTEV